MLSRPRLVRTLAAGLPLWSVVLCLAVGCTHHEVVSPDVLSEHILPPPDVPSNGVTESTAMTPLPAAERVGPGSPSEIDAENARLRGSAKESGAGCAPAQTLTLPEAIATAFQQQPRLRVFLESVEQAQRGEDIAFAPFLPIVAASYSVGGFDLNVGGHNAVTVGPLPGFTFLPALGAIPFGLNINTGYEFAELKLQWLVCDFGLAAGTVSPGWSRPRDRSAPE